MRVRNLAVSATVLIALAACTATAPSPSPRPTPSPTATPTSIPSPAGTPSGAIVVTFRVVEETYRILLIDPADIEIANQLLDGNEAPGIPNGRIVRGETGVNEGYSWSIDPESVEFADFTIEVCDGLPSHVEDGTLTGDQFCPWSAEVIDIAPAE